MGLLPELLGSAVRAFSRDAEAVDVRPPFRLALWANLLRLLDGDGVPLREVAPRSRRSRRAATPDVTALTRWGWVTVEGEARRKVVRLTRSGQAVADTWRPVPDLIEQRWRSALGPGCVDRLRDALVALVGRLPLEHPHYPATYGLADLTIAGGFGLADHGADWRPIPRTEDDRAAVARLPLYALLSQALTAFALDYEAEERTPFEVATVVRHIPDDGMPLTDLASRFGLTRRPGYSLARFGLAARGRDPATRREVVGLTAPARAWRDAYRPAVSRITDVWRTAYGADTVADLLGAAEALGSAELG